MIVKKRWIKTKYSSNSFVIRKKWAKEGWFLFGIIPLYIRDLTNRKV